MGNGDFLHGITNGAAGAGAGGYNPLKGPKGDKGDPGPPEYTIPRLKIMRRSFQAVDPDTGEATPATPPGFQLLRFYFEGANPQFLSLNPQIWLFRWSNRRRKKRADGADVPLPGGGGLIMGGYRRSRWAHPSHHCGVNFPGGGYFGGSTYLDNGNGGAPVPVTINLDTEWPTDSGFGARGYIDVMIDLRNWFPGKLNDEGEPNPDLPSFVDMPEWNPTDYPDGLPPLYHIGGYNKQRSKFKVVFALVIDAPPGAVGMAKRSGKLIGPYSEEWVIFARPKVFERYDDDGNVIGFGAKSYRLQINKAT